MKLKRLIAMLLALAMVFAVSACGKTDKPNTDAVPDQTPTVEDNTPADTSTPAETDKPADTSSPAQALLAEFKSISDTAAMSAEDIANQLAVNPVIVFGPVVMQVEEGYLNGFSKEITGFTEGAIFAPMIGSIPFVGYVFAVDGDVQSFMQELKDSADLRWNICTQADEMVCEANGSKVLLVMSPATFEE